MSIFFLINACRYILQKWVVILYVTFIYTMPGWAEPDTAKIAIKLIIHPAIKAFTHTPVNVISSPAVNAVDDLLTTQLCFSQQGLKGFDVFIGKQFKQASPRSSAIANKGCYLPFLQMTGRDFRQVSESSKQPVTLTISPL